MRGMLKKVKDYVAWGEVSEALVQELVAKRGEPSPDDPKKTKKYFRLHPPRGGFERGGIKRGFKVGGVLGYRGDKIELLIRKML